MYLSEMDAIRDEIKRLEQGDGEAVGAVRMAVDEINEILDELSIDIAARMGYMPHKDEEKANEAVEYIRKEIVNRFLK